MNKSNFMHNVVIGIVNKNGQLLMIKRAKQEGNLIWGFPGGKVEKNETLEDACIREIYEETGINARIISCIGERVHPDTQTSITYFLCKYISGEPTIFNSNEILEVEYKNKENIYNCIKTDIFAPLKQYIDNYVL